MIKGCYVVSVWVGELNEREYCVWGICQSCGLICQSYGLSDGVGLIG